MNKDTQDTLKGDAHETDNAHHDIAHRMGRFAVGLAQYVVDIKHRFVGDDTYHELELRAKDADRRALGFQLRAIEAEHKLESAENETETVIEERDYIKTHDTLLPNILNRHGLYGKIEEYARNKNTQRLHLFFVDIKGFKKYNDISHPLGDKALDVCGWLMQKYFQVPANDQGGDESLVARFGGDEFVAALPDKGELNDTYVGSSIEHKVARTRRHERDPLIYKDITTVNLPKLIKHIQNENLDMPVRIYDAVNEIIDQNINEIEFYVNGITIDEIAEPGLIQEQVIQCLEQFGYMKSIRGGNKLDNDGSAA